MGFEYTYQPLGGAGGLADGAAAEQPTYQLARSRRLSKLLTYLCTLLACGNVYQLWYIHSSSQADLDISTYAKLPRNVPMPWTLHSPYNDNNDTAQTLARWDKVDIDPGTVALSDDFVEEHGLPTAQRFPWDAEKGIYLLNGFHNLHCLKKLYRAVSEARDGVEQTTPWGHAIHCIDALRQEVLCEADDTPRYTGFQPPKSSALGQVRMCRDWSKLEEWAQQTERHGCYHYAGNTKTGFQSVEQYKFCPEDSPYNKRIESVFGPRDSWDWEKTVA